MKKNILVNVDTGLIQYALKNPITFNDMVKVRQELDRCRNFDYNLSQMSDKKFLTLNEESPIVIFLKSLIKYLKRWCK